VTCQREGITASAPVSVMAIDGNIEGKRSHGRNHDSQPQKPTGLLIARLISYTWAAASQPRKTECQYPF